VFEWPERARPSRSAINLCVSAFHNNFICTIRSGRRTRIAQSDSDYTTGCTQVSISGRARFFSSPRRPDRLWAHPATCPMGTGVFSSGVNRPGREANHSPSSSTEVKNACSNTSTPWRGVLFEPGGNFTFTVYLSQLWLAIKWTAEVRFPAGARTFLFATTAPRPPCDTHSLLFSGGLISRWQNG
jgi:hypothetical protein